jgi:hypothetical protein
MFRSYCFEHPKTEELQRVTPWSYVLAGFLGPIYVLFRRCDGVLPALAIAVALSLGLVALSGVTSYLPTRTQFLAILVAVPAGLMVQSVMVIGLVKRSYRRRGWLIRAG